MVIRGHQTEVGQYSSQGSSFAEAHLSPPSGFAAALARCALTWHQQPGAAATLEAITADTLALLRGADAAAVVTVSTTGTLQIKASSGPIGKLHAALPRTLTPNLRALYSQPRLAVDRWPVSAMLDHHAQMGSMIYVPLGSGQIMFGTLMVLGFTADAFTPASATALAIHASIAGRATTARPLGTGVGLPRCHRTGQRHPDAPTATDRSPSLHCPAARLI